MSDAAVFDAHARAARLVGEGRFAEAIDALKGIVKAHPELGAVHYGIGQLLARTGRLDEAAAAFERAEQTWPDSLPVPLALGDVAARAWASWNWPGRRPRRRSRAPSAARRRDRVAAHESAARVALALDGRGGGHHLRGGAVEVDPTSALPRFVKGRLLFDEGKYEEAVEAFTEAATSR